MTTSMTRRQAIKLCGGTLAGAGLLAAAPAHAATTAGWRNPGQGFPVAGPVLWTTDEMVETAKARVEAEQMPFHDAWLNVRVSADRALGREFVPYLSPEWIPDYAKRGREHGKVTRDLALGYRITGDDRYLAKAREILLVWAAAAEEANSWPDSYPASGIPHGAGLFLGLITAPFADAYAVLYDDLNADDREAVGAWFRSFVAPIKESQRIWREEPTDKWLEARGVVLDVPYLGHQYFNNHLSAHILGLLSIGFALNDHQLIRYAIKHPSNPRDLQEMIHGAIIMPEDFRSGEPADIWRNDPTYTKGHPPPAPGEIYDRYRSGALGYSFLHLEMLTLLAEMVKNNNQGVDYYRHVGPGGENLEVSFEFYAPFFSTGETGVRTGYYANDRIPFETMPVYELAHRHYPGNDQIWEVLRSRGRVHYEDLFWGWTAVLTHGLDN